MHLSIISSAFISVAVSVTLYHPFPISDALFVVAVNAPPSLDMFAVTVSPVSGVAKSVSSTILNNSVRSTPFLIPVVA